MADAKVTIAVPSYNQGSYLDDALASIFEQGLPVEVFVMDGGSSDNSIEVIKKYESHLAGWRSSQDKGQAAAINEGIARGSAPYVCWLNSDDFFYPHGLQQLLKSLRQNPDSNFAYGRCWTVSKQGKKLSPYVTLPFSPRIFASFCFIAQPATLITRSAWEQLGGLNINMQMAFDFDLWWRLYKEFGKPVYCKNFAAATRMHRETKTATQVELHYQESTETVLKHYGAIPFKWRAALPFMKIVRRFNI